MIFSFLLAVAGIIINIIAFLFGILAWAMPDQVTDAVEYFISYLAYLGFLFPVNTLLEAFGFLLSFYAVMQLYNLAVFVLSLLPFSKNIKYPEIHNPHNFGNLTQRSQNVDGEKITYWGSK